MKDLIPVNIPQCEISRTAAKFSEQMTYEQWAETGAQLATVTGCCLWWVGDWLLFGVKQYGDRSRIAAENADALGYAPQTLRQAMTVSMAVEDFRRLKSLSWTHHQEVAALGAKEQEKWLKLADENKWTVAELRKQIRLSLGKLDANQPDGPVLRTVGNKLDDVATFLLHRPGDWWDEEKRQIWRERLKPIVEWFNSNLA